MALPWKTILTHVPWNDVLGNAPKIADGARKLWSGLGRKAGDATASDPGTDAPPPAGADFSTRLDLLEAANRKLRTQVLASGELIQTLSEQNALLVEQIERQRRHACRQAWLLTATAVIASLALLLAWQPRLTEFLA